MKRNGGEEAKEITEVGGARCEKIFLGVAYSMGLLDRNSMRLHDFSVPPLWVRGYPIFFAPPFRAGGVGHAGCFRHLLPGRG